MIKISGMVLIVLCCSMAGTFKASGLSKKVSILETTIRLYQYLRDRLKYLRPSVASLINQAASADEFASLSFLAECDRKMSGGDDFSESWNQAVLHDTDSLGKEAAKIIASLSGVLGASDLESQLAAIDYGVAMLEARLAYAREYAAKHRKLYQTLGVLTGLGIAIFIA